MPLLTVVGPPGVGKTYIATQVADRLGPEVCTLVTSPKVGQAENLAVYPLTVEDVYAWAFKMVHNLHNYESNHLYIFDGFPLPDVWVLDSKPVWGIREKNLEVRMHFKRAAQVIALPSSWKNWKAKAIHEHYVDSEVAQRMRDNYDRFLSKTTLSGIKVNVSKSLFADIDKLVDDIGIVR